MKSAVVVGSLNLDYSIALQRMPQPGETIAADSLTLNPGGKGANQAYALGRLGCRTAMIGAVGRDGAGDTLIRNLQSAGVDCSGVLRREEPTGQAFITVDKQGENSIIILHGANYTLTPADIEEKRALIEAADCLVMQLEVPMETVLAAAKLARAAGKTVVLDPAPAPGPLPEELLRLCDFVKPNETELSLLTGMPAGSREECEAAAKTLLQKGVGTVLVSLGAKGALAVTPHGSVLMPPPKVKAVDSTSAGDCFTAAFVSRWDGGLEPALRYANAAAAIAVSRRGAQASIPSAAEVEDFIQ